MKANPGSSKSHTYRPDIDGLRAIAVLFVIIFHAFPRLAPGGFIGVDLFFVISGFLISSLIFDQVRLGQFSFIEFYARRVRRIFPALLVVLFFALVVGWFFLLPTEYRSLSKQVYSAGLFAANLFFYHEIGYFDTAAYTKPLLHLWSLGIEEQFYLVWPLLVTMCWRLFGEKTHHILIAVTLMSLGLNIATIKADPDWSFFLPFTRAWELSAGAMLAWYHVFPVRTRIAAVLAQHKSILGLIGMVLIIASGFLVPFLSDHIRVAALLPVMGMGLVIASGPDAWVQRRILSHPVLVFIGLISYPLYLWHWPLLSYGQIIGNGPLSVPQTSLLIAATFILALLTYRLVEQPIRVRRKIADRTLVMAMIVVTIAGLVIAKNHGITARTLGGHDRHYISEAASDWGFPGTLIKKQDHDLTYYVTSDEGPPRVVFFGDSHIEQLTPWITKQAASRPIGPVALVTNPGCPGGLDVHEDHLKCDGVIDQFQAFLARTPSIKRVVVGGCWNCAYDTAPDRKHFRYVRRGTDKIYLDTEAGRQLSLQSLQSFLINIAAHYQTYLILDNPSSPSFHPAHILGSRWSFYFGSPHDLNTIFAVDPFQVQLNTRLKSLVTGTKVKIIDQIDTICPHGQCRAVDAGAKPIYKDEDHMRPFFVIDHASYLNAVFK